MWKIQQFREIGNLKHIYQNELDRASFAHDGACSHSKDLAKSTDWDRNLKQRELMKLL